MLRKHIHYTNSEKAKRILNNFESHSSRFLKIMPNDFKEALKSNENNINIEQRGI